MNTPEKRPKELEQVSDEHYDALFFGWKIAEGLRNNIETDRLKAYADWFMKHYLIPHIKVEEKYIFPILGINNVRVKRALANHRRLKRLFSDTKNVYRSLNRIEEEIGQYIRFEERVLLKQIQEKATPEELEEIRKQHDKIKLPDDSWEDRFWEGIGEE